MVSSISWSTCYVIQAQAYQLGYSIFCLFFSAWSIIFKTDGDRASYYSSWFIYFPLQFHQSLLDVLWDSYWLLIYAHSGWILLSIFPFTVNIPFCLLGCVLHSFLLYPWLGLLSQLTLVHLPGIAFQHFYFLVIFLSSFIFNISVFLNTSVSSWGMYY